jgi:hypothetical protein
MPQYLFHLRVYMLEYMLENMRYMLLHKSLLPITISFFLFTGKISRDDTMNEEPESVALRISKPVGKKLVELAEISEGKRFLRGFRVTSGMMAFPLYYLHFLSLVQKGKISYSLPKELRPLFISHQC